VSVDEPAADAALTSTASAPVIAPDNGSNGLIVPRRRHRFVAEEAPTSTPAPPVDEPHELSKKEAKQLNRLRARKVRRVVRNVDPWSVLKLSLLFYLCLFVIVMVAGTILWNLAGAAGTISDIEGVVKEAGAFKTFTFDGPTIFRATFLGGLVLVVAGSGLNVLIAVLFNLISDLVGGIRITVIEEETARPIAVEDRSARR
jgi:hypothetical protein